MQGKFDTYLHAMHRLCLQGCLLGVFGITSDEIPMNMTNYHRGTSESCKVSHICLLRLYLRARPAPDAQNVIIIYRANQRRQQPRPIPDETNLRNNEDLALQTPSAMEAALNITDHPEIRLRFMPLSASPNGCGNTRPPYAMEEAS